MARGHLCLVLHAHLPYVRHPEHDSFLEERWLFEALVECYLPILEKLQALYVENIPYRMTLVLSPTLVHMLRDELLLERFDRHLTALERLAGREQRRLADDPPRRALARFYEQRFATARSVWEHCGRDVVSGLSQLEASGHLEVMTCAATHGMLPMLASVPEAVRAQIQVGVGSHIDAFGRAPRGMWLPECGFYPGLDELLAQAGIRFTVLETHGLLDGSVPPRYGVYAPVYTPAGVAVFGRDPESSRQVWSTESGYPGDFAYRDFYRDIGFDLDAPQLGELAHPDSIPLFTGIKYHRITHDRGLEDKELYDPALGIARAAEHARNFVYTRTSHVERLVDGMDRPPVVVAPYDAELFGHWWFEGPDFLAQLMRTIHGGAGDLSTATLAEVLRARSRNQMIVPSASTWGAGGYNEVWIEGSNSWLVRHVIRGSRMMVDLARSNPRPSKVQRRALDQAAREILLAQSSDWPFMMKTGQASGFASSHARVHLGRFARLAHDIDTGQVDRDWLADLEWRDNVFPSMHYEVFT